jgi:hypothetical protein
MAAAAAVGNIDAMRHFSAVGGRALGLVLKNVGRYQMLHCFYNPIRAAASTAMTVVLVASEIKKHFSRGVIKAEAGSMMMVLRLVVKGKLHVPTEPLPFCQLAQEVLDWTQTNDAPKGMRKLMAKLGL